MSFLLRRTLPRLRHLAITHAPNASRLAISCTNQDRRLYSTQKSQTAIRRIVEPDALIEEETLDCYRPERYYPVDIGDILHQRYKVIGKLGYGVTSTVWLCRDLQEGEKFVALKVYINSSRAHHEPAIYDHLNSLRSEHPGRGFIRNLLDTFEITGPHGKHTCLVHEALGMSLQDLRELFKSQEEKLSPHLFRWYFRGLLSALEFLRDEAHIIHTDIQPKNILLRTVDDSKFSKFEEDEQKMPFPKKQLESHSVYVSRPMRFTRGACALCDFGEARVDIGNNTGHVMPDVYRAPEVILDMPWSYPIDLWAVAMTIWHLLQSRLLFRPCDENGRCSEEYILAQMIAIMGPPPLDFLQRSEKSELFWDKEGNWKGTVQIPDITLEKADQRFHGQEKAHFMTFMRKMLQWKPEDRSSLNDVFEDEWLLADLIEEGIVVVDG